ncbi:MAG: rod shape-determining protein MreC [Alphaproteobacteria bacterium]|nr:rod shape-determining protein MreC [Alphaproteobacteria bacterium]
MESKMFRLKRIKSQIRRLVPVLFLLVGLLCLVLWKTNNSYISSVRMYVLDKVAPVVDVLATPSRWFDSLSEKVKNAVFVYKRNEALEKENEYLRQWRSVAIQLGAEQQEMKELLQYVNYPKALSRTARIVMDQGGLLARGVIALAGQTDGIEVGAIALTSKGLFARVINVSPHMSQLMPMTDYLSRVPVWVGKDRIEALMIGNNSNHPKLIMIENPSAIQSGDIVVTSGYLGVYPSGLSVGLVGDIVDDDIQVDLFETGEKLNFVRLFDFGEKGVLIQNECACQEQ